MGEMMEMQTRSRGLFDSLVSFFGRVIHCNHHPCDHFCCALAGIYLPARQRCSTMDHRHHRHRVGCRGCGSLVFCRQLGSRKDAACLGAPVAAFRLRWPGSGDPVLVHVSTRHTYIYHELAECRQHPIRWLDKIISMFLLNGSCWRPSATTYCGSSLVLLLLL